MRVGLIWGSNLADAKAMVYGWIYLNFNGRGPAPVATSQVHIWESGSVRQKELALIIGKIDLQNV